MIVLIGVHVKLPLGQCVHVYAMEVVVWFGSNGGAKKRRVKKEEISLIPTATLATLRRDLTFACSN
jgi:hypothetical protein